MNNASTSSAPAIQPVPLNNHQHHQNHTIVPINQPPVPPPPNLPCLDLLQGSREEYISIGVPLYEASITGNWKAAEPIFEKRRELTRFAISENYETPLHIAASAESTKSVEEFVEKLVNMMDKKDLLLQNRNYDTAFCKAAAAGNVKTAMIMVNKNRDVLEIPGGSDLMPLHMAALYAKPNMVRYLYDNSNMMSGKFWTHENRGWVLQKCVEVDLFDVAIKIVNAHPELADDKSLLADVLLALAEKTDAFKERKLHILLRIIKSTSAIFHVNVGNTENKSDALGLLRILWQKIAVMHKSKIDDIIRGPALTVGTPKSPIITYPSRALFHAAKMGSTRFIIELIQSYPDLIWTVDDKGQTIFHIAIKSCQANIYNLLYEIGSMKDLITIIVDENGNTMLHLVAMSNSKQFEEVSGAKCNDTYYGSRR